MDSGALQTTDALTGHLTVGTSTADGKAWLNGGTVSIYTAGGDTAFGKLEVDGTQPNDNPTANVGGVTFNLNCSIDLNSTQCAVFQVGTQPSLGGTLNFTGVCTLHIQPQSNGGKSGNNKWKVFLFKQGLNQDTDHIKVDPPAPYKLNLNVPGVVEVDNT